MARKLRCTVTGNWSYCSEERYQKLVEKFGGEAELTAKYVSREGKKVAETGGTAPEDFKNKIRCTLTGELCYISDERMKKLAHKAGSQQKVRDSYVSRVAKRLLKAGKTEAEIKAMAAAGTLPSAAEIKAMVPPATPPAADGTVVDGAAAPKAQKKAAKKGAKKAVAKKATAK